MQEVELDSVFQIIRRLTVDDEDALERVASNRLRFGGDHTPDYVDLCCVRIAAAALSSNRPTLLVFPDGAPRRSPLVFGANLVLEGLRHIGAVRIPRPILYVGQYSGIRHQLGDTSLGGQPLGSVFAQDAGHGTASRLRATGPFSRLPLVVSVYAPTSIDALIQRYNPSWIAVDCADCAQLAWIDGLLRAAVNRSIPILGWTSAHLSTVPTAWIQQGGSVFRWPTLQNPENKVQTSADLAEQSLVAALQPIVPDSRDASAAAHTLALASEAVLALHRAARSRLASDGAALAWRLLRRVESLPVNASDFDQMAAGRWGVVPTERLLSALQKFARPISEHDPHVAQTFETAVGCLTAAYEQVAFLHPPMWETLAALALQGETCLVFPSRTHLDAFAFRMLASHNISATDLREIDVRLCTMSDASKDARDALLKNSDADTASYIVFGLPGRHLEPYLESLFRRGNLGIVLWEHQIAVLQYRVYRWNAQCAWSAEGPLFVGETPSTDPAMNCPDLACRISLNEAQRVSSGQREDAGNGSISPARLWTRPDSAQAVAELFSSAHEDSSEAPGTHSSPNRPGQASQDDFIVDVAISLNFEHGQRIRFSPMDSVQVVCRTSEGLGLEHRYVRSVRPGEEIVYIPGQRRQDLYELLCSRVHRDPTISRYLDLVDRWQNELHESFKQAAQARKMTVDVLLEEIQGRGSKLRSTATLRTWLRGDVLVPNNLQDLRRTAEVLDLRFTRDWASQIHLAGRKLKGLHINLSTRLNRWLSSAGASTMVASSHDDLIDADLGLTVADFEHSVLRLRVATVEEEQGPFYDSSLRVLL